MSDANKTTALIILDGWGYREDTEQNAIHSGHTPVWDKLWSEAPHSLISGSGEDVGLPDGQMGNSEVGHMNLGAGRVVYQDFTRITKAIRDGEFQHNPVFCTAIDQAVAAGRAVHLMGLLSPGGVHSHEDHMLALIDLAVARGAKQVYLHAFLDGRDMPPRSAEPSLVKLDQHLKALGVGRIASVVGRYYAMDRDNNWERVETAYRLLSEGRGLFQSESAVEALAAAYARDENDEFVQATAVVPAGGEAVAIADGDALFFMNFRADRARQLSRVFVDDAFTGFARAVRPALGAFVTLTQYAADLPAPIAFPPARLDNVLGEYLANLGKTQLRIAETEKYAHVTFFFSGGREQPFAGETRILINSPKVATYDLKPEMSAFEVTDKLVEAIRSRAFDLIVCNFANGDMVGHSGVFSAAVQAVEAVDQCLGRILEALAEVNGQALITADHGNCEQMSDPVTGQAHTAHTCEPVPMIYVGDQAVRFRAGGILSDVAPTLLTLMALEVPQEMTGTSLLSIQS